MDLTPYIAELQDSLVAAAAAGDENTRRAAELLGAALEPAARLALMRALSDLALEVTEELDGALVEVRLDGRDITVVVSGAGPDDDEPPLPMPPADAAGEISRVTLRLAEELKSEAEREAARQGVSLNAWLAQAVHNALHAGGRRQQARGGRVSGWVTG